MDDSSYLIFEGDSTTVHDFFAFCAFRGKFLFETTDAVDVGVVGNYKRATADLSTRKNGLKPSCDTRFQPALPACYCVFKFILLV